MPWDDARPPIFFFLPDPEGSDPEKQAQFVRLMMMMFFMYPIFGAIGGWVGGLVGSFGYNLVSKWLGGIRIVLETDRESATPSQVA